MNENAGLSITVTISIHSASHYAKVEPIGLNAKLGLSILITSAHRKLLRPIVSLHSLKRTSIL